MALRFLVVDGNTAEGRERQRTRLGRTAGEGYAGCLRFLAPGAVIDHCNPADPNPDLPCSQSLLAYDGVVLTGSALHLWENQPDSLQQVEFAKRVFASGVPFFGSCWGLQVATVAAGGKVEKNPAGRESGIARAIQITEAGKAHPLLAGRAPVFDAPCMHLDTVTELAPDMTVLASNAISPVQAAEIRFDGGIFWGVQYHPEFTLSHTANLLSNNMDIHVSEGRFATPEQGHAYCDDLRAVSFDPTLHHIVWRYGLGSELLDRHVRLSEVKNFIDARAKPYAAQHRDAA